MIRKLLIPALLSSALALPVMTAHADESRYSSSWGDKSEASETSGGSVVQELAKELNALIDEADRARAADPLFLQDLRDKIAEYVEAAPAPSAGRKAIFRDDFSDGDYTQAPEWVVVSGQYSVDDELGLRSVVRLAPGSGEDDGAVPSIDEIGDMAKGAFDDIMGSSDAKPDQDTAPAELESAEIFVAHPISNAFALEFELTSRIATQGSRLEIDIFQGRDRASGYRLSYLPGEDPALELSRFGRRGVFVITEYDDELTLEDGYAHKVALDRAADGTMRVTVDGEELILASSTAFGDPFDGLSIVNVGGDYAFREITVYGVE